MMRNFNLFSAILISTTLLVPIFCTEDNFYKNALEGEGIEKDRCAMVSNWTYVQEVLFGSLFYTTCLDISTKTSKKQMEVLIQNNEWSTIISKYCSNHKPTVLSDCIDKLDPMFDGCLKPKETDNINMYMNALHKQVNFLCHKDGERVHFFLDRKGLDCFAYQKHNLNDCYETAVIRLRNVTVDTSTTFGVCDELKTVEGCVNEHLEKCENSTPADLAKLMFKQFGKDVGCGSLTSVNVSAVSSTSDGSQ